MDEQFSMETHDLQPLLVQMELDSYWIIILDQFWKLGHKRTNMSYDARLNKRITRLTHFSQSVHTVSPIEGYPDQWIRCCSMLAVVHTLLHLAYP